jgi:hypothetical protein
MRKFYILPILQAFAQNTKYKFKGFPMDLNLPERLWTGDQQAFSKEAAHWNLDDVFFFALSAASRVGFFGSDGARCLKYLSDSSSESQIV